MRQPPFCGEGGETPFAGRRWPAAMAPLIGELSAKLTERLRGMRRGRQAQKGGETRCIAEPISYKSAV